MQLSAGLDEGSPVVRALRAALDLGLYGFAFSLGMGIAPIQISLAVVLGATIALHACGIPVLRPTALDRPIAFYLLAVLVGAIAERASGASFLAPDVYGVWRFGAAIVLAGAIGDARRAYRLGQVFVAAVSIQGAYGILQHFTGIDLLHGQDSGNLSVAPFTTDRWLVAGTYSRHATFAFVGGTAMILVAAAYIAGTLRGRRRWLAGLCVVPIGFGALFTTLRMIWGGFAAAVAAIAVVGRTGRRLGVPVAVMVALVTASALLSPAIMAKMERVADPEFANNAHRGFMWARSMAMLEDHPVTGIGAGTYTPRTHVYYDPYSPHFAVRCHSHNNFLFAWVESGPAGLLALVWLYVAALAALRRGAKAVGPPEVPAEARAAVWGATGVVAATVAWSFAHDPLYDGVIAYTLAFSIALGLAAAGSAAAPAPDETVLGEVPEREAEPDEVPAPGTTAAIAAVAMAAASLGGALDVRGVTPGAGLAAAVLLAVLGLGHVPGLPGRLGPVLRGAAGFAGAVALASRAFLPKLIPGSQGWWATPGAAVAVAALVAGLAGAAWAIRRPGQVGPAPVAGAAAFVFAAGWIGLNHYVLLRWLGVWDAAMPTSYNFAAAAGAASLLFVAWSGPLGWGEVEARGFARRLARLPLAAVAVGLAVIAAAGLIR
jgi:hypothetical protein